MNIPNYTKADIKEMKDRINQMGIKLPKHEEYKYENLLLIKLCFGEWALISAIKQLTGVVS